MKLKINKTSIKEQRTKNNKKRIEVEITITERVKP
jgi:hypothetical protein